VRREEAAALPYSVVEDRIRLRVRVTPRAAAARTGGLHRDADGRVSLLVRVTTPPEKGKANKAVIETLGRALGIAKSRLSIEAGDTDRNKIISIAGEPDEIGRALRKLLEQDH
jgi:uncharacterized protein (TIGR00251 family)